MKTYRCCPSHALRLAIQAEFPEGSEIECSIYEDKLSLSSSGHKLLRLDEHLTIALAEELKGLALHQTIAQFGWQIGWHDCTGYCGRLLVFEDNFERWMAERYPRQTAQA